MHDQKHSELEDIRREIKQVGEHFESEVQTRKQFE